jgi:hypothetical protein
LVSNFVLFRLTRGLYVLENYNETETCPWKKEISSKAELKRSFLHVSTTDFNTVIRKGSFFPDFPDEEAAFLLQDLFFFIASLN